MCKKGWKGLDCSEPDNEALQCLPDCSGHGLFNLETQGCSCEPQWTGEDCSKRKEFTVKVSFAVLNGGIIRTLQHGLWAEWHLYRTRV